jgi:tetratricopeptide (TPR) repeat protein
VANLAGWAVLGLPLMLWVGAGWVALYWLVLAFRFMKRSEKLVALILLLAVMLSIPAQRIVVALYGTWADPAVRTTLAAATGEYDPDRVVRLQRLVDAHPDDPVYRFLLAGLYKNGRYVEEAFAEYKLALAIDPQLTAAQINIGNIFHSTGQFGEAIRYYQAAADHDPDSFLAHFNLHLAQSEDFRFSTAEQSLNRARELDAKRVAQLMSSNGGNRPTVRDATLTMTSVWESALGGGRGEIFRSESGGAVRLSGLLNPVSVVALLSLVACPLSLLLSRPHGPARRCIRCGRPYCHRCNNTREAREYCGQCVHMYVLGDGLEPGAKSRKAYEVERHQRRTRRLRSALSMLLPGTAQLLRGHPGRGCLLLLAWFAVVMVALPVLAAPLGLQPTDLLHRDILATQDVPAVWGFSALPALCLLLIPIVWSAGNVWRWRRVN